MNRIVHTTLVMLFLLVSSSKAQNCLITFTSQQSNGQVSFSASNNAVFGNFYWDFGDGNTSTLANPTHTYLQPGTYFVCLIASIPTTTGIVCTSTWCDSVTVGSTPPPPCNANFTYQPCNNTGSVTGSICFTSSPNTTFATYSWDFGDGTTSALASPSHAYAQPGTYYVCLIVNVIASNTGVVCTATWCDSVTVGSTPPPPVPCNANFTYQPCNNSTVTGSICFTSSPNTTFATYSWDFGDGTISTLANPSHVYAQPGTYYVCLTVSVQTSVGTICTATWCDSVTVGSTPPPPPPCNANFTYQPCNNTGSVTGSICFTSSPNTTFATYFWDFGDGTTSALANPSHAYAQPGTYYVCLTVNVIASNTGEVCTATWCDSVTVGSTPPPPVPCNANFTYQPCNNSTVTGSICFTSSPNTTFATYSWDFGDGTISTLANPSHVYAQPGTYYVCLTVSVQTSVGTICTATWCDSVTVGSTPPPPVPCNATFTYQPCNNSTVTGSICFTSFPNTTFATYSWDFGDGTTSTLANPSHAYAQPGTYYVCLTVNVIASNTGVVCTATWCDSVTVGSTPPPTPFNCNPNFTAQSCSTSLNASNGVCFTSAPNPPGTIYMWNFGDGNSSNLANPVHNYSSPGNYMVCLTVSVPGTTGTIACTATWCNGINAVNTPVVNIYPNLVNESIDISVVNATSPVDFYLFNSMGLQIYMQKGLANGNINFDGNKPKSGLYYYYFVENGNIISQGKLVVN